MADTSGFYRGRHYTTYVEEVKAFKRAGDYSRAEALLLALVEAVETEARVKRWGVAPWYYDQLALIYRKTRQPERELQIVERYASHWRPKDGPLPARAVAAIEKARRRAGQDALDQPRSIQTRLSLLVSTTVRSCQ